MAEWNGLIDHKVDDTVGVIDLSDWGHHLPATGDRASYTRNSQNGKAVYEWKGISVEVGWCPIQDGYIVVECWSNVFKGMSEDVLTARVRVRDIDQESDGWLKPRGKRMTEHDMLPGVKRMLSRIVSAMVVHWLITSPDMY